MKQEKDVFIRIKCDFVGLYRRVQTLSFTPQALHTVPRTLFSLRVARPSLYIGKLLQNPWHLGSRSVVSSVYLGFLHQ